MKKKLVTFVVMLVFFGASLAFSGEAVAEEGGGIIHIVKRGDTLWKLSNYYGVSVNLLRERNNLSSDLLMEGQRLIIKPDDSNTLYYSYTVQRGDSPWIISRKFGIALNTFLKANNMISSVVLYPGQVVKIPKVNQDDSVLTSDYIIHTVQKGDTPWLISRRYGVSLEQLLELNNLTSKSILYVGEKIKIPEVLRENLENPEPWITYTTHTVKSGETAWTISIKYGIPFQELLKANGLNENSFVYEGQILTVPVHHVPVHSTVSSKHGELLDWWTEAQYVWPINTVATVVDFYTGRNWQMKRTFGAFHADVEPLTSKDTKIMKEVWGGEWSWKVRPVLIIVNGHRIAASASAMPHSIEAIGWENDFYGHCDIHFLNSTRHKDNTISQDHQKAVYIAAGR